jgi:hypothetical protein
MLTIEEAVLTYVAAFNTNDPAERQRLIITFGGSDD